VNSLSPEHKDRALLRVKSSRILKPIACRLRDLAYNSDMRCHTGAAVK